MKRTMIELRTFKVYLWCDCGAQMKWNNTCLTVNPPLFPHTCMGCGNTETVHQSYPYTHEVEVGEEQDVAD